jgi:acyl carrier protein
MERTEIQTEIGEILYSVFKHRNFEMHDALSAKDVDGWDSLTHMVIITKIEDQFKIKFKLRDLNKLNNMGNLLDLVKSKLDEK